MTDQQVPATPAEQAEVHPRTPGKLLLEGVAEVVGCVAVVIAFLAVSDAVESTWSSHRAATVVVVLASTAFLLYGAWALRRRSHGEGRGRIARPAAFCATVLGVLLTLCLPYVWLF
ncbi:threonine/homoserine/homoserine lactone efflux protein [Kitasatospora gansuensis]|uniref:Threonine/homoserine/homoserine lactone efflux protein n=1 Tax=Kitasatospora gansuensis TaxID=258050 RepID=A0A7W7WGF0_9ACTN|nr:hypothetical protein [Kitasatospora gansuensis]MBB4945958.1 threonine/homoserine/homoserine lactone efflux protein [Kitasatospora gansuensis]